MRENLDEARVQSIWWAGGEHRDTYLFSLQPNPISEEPLPAHAELFRDQQPTAAVEKIAGSALNSTHPVGPKIQQATGSSESSGFTARCDGAKPAPD